MNKFVRITRSFNVSLAALLLASVCSNSLAHAQERVNDLPQTATPQLSTLRLVVTSADSNARDTSIWSDLLERHIPAFDSGAEPHSITPSLLRKLQADIRSILSTEGFFSPTIRFGQREEAEQTTVVYVDAGKRTIIKELSINLIGSLNDAANVGQVQAMARRSELFTTWQLPQGAPFRDEKWNQSKTLLLENLRSNSYAGASIIDSRASIDPDNHSAVLEVDIDSGPPFIMGDMFVTGLERYPLWLLDRYNPPKKGEPYSSARLLEFQRALQNSAYFSTVTFNVEPEVVNANALPIEVSLTERKTRDAGYGAGYSSSTGFRTELTYRDRNFFGRMWDLTSAVRLEQKRQLTYADINLPPNDNHRLDSFGVLWDRLNVEGQIQTRAIFGVKRTITHGLLEQRIGANFTQEKVVRADTPVQYSRALIGTLGWTWRDVDDVFMPRHGTRAQLDFAASEKALISDQRFFRVYGKYQYWMPIGRQDDLLLRAELGHIFADSPVGIPEDILFRTGGSASVRGYAYQSLGIKKGQAVGGGRVMGTASAEYVHWIDSAWGVASFVDIGDAANTWREFKAKQGLGLGARIKTPAGPVAVDVAYGRASKKIRLDVSIAIAF